MQLRALVYTRRGDIRAPWRLLVFAAAAAAFAIPMLFARTLLPAAAEARPLDVMWDSLALALALAAATWYALRRVDGRGWSGVWMDPAAASPGRLLSGWLLGTCAIGIPAIVLVAVGWLRFVPAADGSVLAAAFMALVVLAPAALMEELLARGYVLSVLRDSLGWWPAIVVTSIPFGLLHAWNPGATAPSIALVTIAGVFLALVLRATRSFWAAVLAHLAWNWTMAALLHAPVSGLGLASPDYRLIDTGPDWATGGSWGPEGGAGAVAGMLVGTMYLYARRLRRGKESGGEWRNGLR